MIQKEIELGTGHIVVTDHGSLAACRSIYDLARSKKLIPILGVEGYFRDDNCPILTAAGIPKNKDGKFSDYIKYNHFTAHALDIQAYQTMVKLLSRAGEHAEQHGQELKPIFGWKEFEELAATNTTITTGCLIGMVPRHLTQRDRPDIGIKYYERMKALVKPGNLFVEIFPHKCDSQWTSGVFIYVNEGTEVKKLKYYPGKKLRTNLGEVSAEQLALEWGKKPHKTLLAVCDYRKWNEREPVGIVKVERIEDFVPNECQPWAPNGDHQQGANLFMLELARKYGDTILIGDDGHFANAEDKIVQDVRLMASGGSWRFSSSYHRQSSEEAFKHFQATLDLPEKVWDEWVENGYAWASRFKDFEWKVKPSLPTKFYPTDTLAHTLTLIEKHGRFDPTNQVYAARLNQELNLLHNNGTIDLLPYFFIDEDVTSVYRDAGLLVGPGRGSAAGLLLSYLLGITHVDPLKYNLSVDRFLTMDRIRSGKMPDIDQDLPSRDLLVDPETGWLKKRFGNHYAQLSTDTTLKCRSAVKDVARALLGHVPPEIEALTRDFLQPPQGLSDSKFVFGYEDAGNWIPGIIDPSLPDEKQDKDILAYIKLY